MLTAGAVSILSVENTTASVLSVAASGGTGPYTYQWHRSTQEGFTPSSGTAVGGATSLTLNDSGLTSGVLYYYKMVSTDTGHSNDMVTSAELPVQVGVPVDNPNQFAQTTRVGQLDEHLNFNTIPAQIDMSQGSDLFPGMAVKMVDSPDGAPKVVGVTAPSDAVLGFINYNIKNKSFKAGDRCELSLAGNVMYLFCTHPYARGVQVSLDLGVNGGVQGLVTGSNIVGWAFDEGQAGQLCRVYLKSPSFQVAP